MTVFLLFGVTAFLIISLVMILIFNSMANIVSITRETQDNFLPRILDRHREALNLERLGRFGMTVLSTEDGELRRKIALAAKLLAQDSTYAPYSPVQTVVWNSNVAIQEIATIRSQQSRQMKRVAGLIQELHESTDRINSFVLSSHSGREAPADLLKLTVLFSEISSKILQVPQVRDLETLGLMEERFKEQKESLLALMSIESADLPGSVRQLGAGMDQYDTIFLLQAAIIEADRKALFLWQRANRMLEQATDSLSTGSAIRVSDRFTTILDAATLSMVFGFIGLSIVAGIFLTLALLLQKYILLPIISTTRALGKIRTEKTIPEMPETSLREFDNIRQAVQKFGEALIRIADQSDKLRKANEDLEQEIEERSRTERELARAKEAAEAADKAKSQFLATMSHEIRTPMNSIQGMADLLSETDLNMEQHEFIRILRSSGESLLAIIDDILDLSKIEAGQLHLEHVGFNLSEVVNTVFQSMALQARQKDLEIIYRISETIPRYLVGDPIRLRQILFNLLSNAIKFTESGEIFLSVEQTEKKGLLLFSLKDTGIGIAPEIKEVIFDIFTQADSSMTRKYGGTGLGLAITKRLVGLLGGSICVESTPGQGSTFSFTAAFEVSDNLMALRSPNPDLAGKHIVIGASNPTLSSILKEYVQSWGGQVHMVDSLHGLKDSLKPGKHHSRDLIIFDTDMMNGVNDSSFYTLFHPIIGEDETLVIPIAVTGNRSWLPEDEFPGGVRVSPPVLKPFGKSALARAVCTVMHTSNTTLKGDHCQNHERSSRSPSEPLDILLVEDSENNRMLIDHFLKDAGHSITFAEDGQKGLDSFKNHDFDLVLMDIQMPVMDGVEATKALRNWEKEQGRQSVPVIALTAHALDVNRKVFLDAGCNDSISKPVKKEELLTTISQVLGFS